jgi:membrane fusion protein (multidrug efflux system)
MKKVFIGGLTLLICFTSCKKKQNTASVDNKTYPVLTLTAQDVQLTSTYPAVLKGEEDIDIKPRIDGFIEAVYVDEGSIVKKGQPLFKINSPVSVQNLQSAQASYNNAKVDVDRMRPLAEKGIISKVKLASYENTLASTKATLDQAKASLSWTNVTSPVSGIVGTLSYRVGSLVNNTTVLTTVSNNSNVVAYFSLNEKDLYAFLHSAKGNTQAEKIKNMPAVKLLLADGNTYGESGKILTISGVVDASGAVNFRAIFPNKQGILRSGTSCKVLIPNVLKNVIVIPQKATYNQQDKVLVYKLQADSVVQKTITVKTTPDGQSYAVTDGLSAGDKIVTDGIVTLKNGKKIKVQ